MPNPSRSRSKRADAKWPTGAPPVVLGFLLAAAALIQALESPRARKNIWKTSKLWCSDAELPAVLIHYETIPKIR